MNALQKTLICALVSLASAPALAAEPIGQIKTAKGVVVVVRDGAELRSLAGAPIYRSDRIVTREDSAVGITFNDNSMLSLGPNSQLDISRFSFGHRGEADGFDSFLSRGTLSAVSGRITQRNPESMRIQTPTTILGVRGTEFLVQVTQP